MPESDNGAVRGGRRAGRSKQALSRPRRLARRDRWERIPIYGARDVDRKCAFTLAYGSYAYVERGRARCFVLVTPVPTMAPSVERYEP